MVTNKRMAADLLEATQLTREGRLQKATDLIQRVLRHGSMAEDVSAYHGSGASNDVIDVEQPAIAGTVERDPVRDRPSRGAKPFRFGSFPDGWPGRDAVAEGTGPLRKPDVSGPGQFVTGSYANQAGERAYKLYIPGNSEGQQLPLVVMLHGCTQTPDDFAQGTRMNALAEEQRCFVLYPAQAHAANHSRCWNWFKRGDQGRDVGEPAILAGMTREVMRRYRVDSGRVYIAGLSAGGAMAAVMAAAYPELYAAVGVHSGLACGSAHDLPSALAAMQGTPSAMSHSPDATNAVPATPTIVFHGDQDKTVHPRNGERVVSRAAGQNGAWSADAAIERARVPGGRAYTRTVHRDDAGRIVLEYWLVHGGGHAWFGGSRGTPYMDPKGPDAAREMIRFFYQHSLPR